ncbi:xyloglucan galactosyltransferase KATAMARI1 homolog [Oryza brachyantha]|uniref:xyloglucan galactosyltransferase KATAMARI1 homolog n=1 Tax=Oryza brachyantha TaxID=4533 RepID=UPI001ADBAADB|nr:xyloglucan galactosyltransferase KATAMARI1 homolog [Oryza brachyantha]
MDGLHLHGSMAVLRAAGRCLLPLVIPASCVLWVLFFFPSPSPELAVRRESFQPTVTLPVQVRRDVGMSPPPPPPPLPERGEIVHASPPPPPARQEHPARRADRCAGRYVYVHELPSRFNSDLLRDCRSLSEWTDMCRHVANAGIGPRLTRTGGVLPATGWYDTNQFTLEVIFHARMKRYGCLTADVSRAAAVYVPYYAGLDVGRYLWGFSNGVRDALAEDLAEWLRSTPAWAAHGGRDHFLVGGRIAWDFRREDGGEGSQWGSRLLLLPEATNMTALVIEASPWHAATDVGVPYPTYFHPWRAADVSAWQRDVRRARRPWLFAFAGGGRRRGDDHHHGGGGVVRDRIIRQCARSRRCGLLRCGAHGRRDDCYDPGNVMRLFKSAAFCLQPRGDSYTRRSVFDAILAGCVPVFFHPGSAYTQYRWHLPRDHTAYSVFVPEDGVRNGTVRLEDVLRRISAAKVAAMREQVIRMIPTVVYRDPRGPSSGVPRDAVDVAVDGMIERIRRIKRGLPPGGEDDGGEHRWDTYFDKQ